MEGLSLTTLYILLLLLPGFTSWIVDRTLVFRPDESTFDKVVRALFYTFAAHVVYAMFFGGFTPWRLSLADTDNTLKIEIDTKAGLITLFAIAVALGCVSGYLKTHVWHMKLAQKLRMTKRTSRSSTWIDVFHDKSEAYVMVHLKDRNRMVFGWPEYYSDIYSNGPVIFLSQAKWVDELGGFEDIPHPGILINGDEIRFVQFYYSKVIQ